VTVSGGQPVVTDVVRPPRPGPGEIEVRVRAAGLNNADLGQLAGRYPAPADAPAGILGLELAGTVVACGRGVARFSAGDDVIALVGGGAQAELAVFNERLAMPKPPAVP
jgi:NADPH:quinone reductase-like Zn-dependent oxidoreductase